MANNAQPLTPKTVGLEPIGSISTPYGDLYEIQTMDYQPLAERLYSKAIAADSGFYSLAGQNNACSLTEQMADVIEMSSLPAPLSLMMPVDSSGNWYNTKNFPVHGQVDTSAFGPVCCGAGTGPSVASNYTSVDYHCATFAISWQLCMIEVLQSKLTNRPANPEAEMMSTIQQIVDYGSSYVALHGFGQIVGLLNNPMVGKFWMPSPLAQMNGREVLAAFSSALSNLDQNSIPSNGYTLWLPGQDIRQMRMTMYQDGMSSPQSIYTILMGGCACPSGMEAVAGMITAIKPMELLRGALPGVGSGDVGILMPNEPANTNPRNAAMYWDRPVPYLPLERQSIGISEFGTVIVHTGDVIVRRPRQVLILRNV